MPKPLAISHPTHYPEDIVSTSSLVLDIFLLTNFGHLTWSEYQKTSLVSEESDFPH